MSNQTPVLGSLSHFCLSVSDYEKSIKYYDTILKKLGYKQYMQKEYYTGWVNTLCGVQFGISSVRPEYKDSKHQRYSVGFNHLALNATSREQVDEFHEFLLENKVTILDEPKEYEYVPGYYAVFWEDPDGMKLELCYVPIPSPEENSENSESVKVDDTDGVEPEGKDHEGNGESDENSPKRQKLE